MILSPSREKKNKKMEKVKKKSWMPELNCQTLSV